MEFGGAQETLISPPHAHIPSPICSRVGDMHGAFVPSSLDTIKGSYFASVHRYTSSWDTQNPSKGSERAASVPSMHTRYDLSHSSNTLFHPVQPINGHTIHHGHHGWRATSAEDFDTAACSPRPSPSSASKHGPNHVSQLLSPRHAIEGCNSIGSDRPGVVNRVDDTSGGQSSPLWSTALFYCQPSSPLTVDHQCGAGVPEDKPKLEQYIASKSRVLLSPSPVPPGSPEPTAQFKGFKIKPDGRKKSPPAPIQVPQRDFGMTIPTSFSQDPSWSAYKGYTTDFRSPRTCTSPPAYHGSTTSSYGLLSPTYWGPPRPSVSPHSLSSPRARLYYQSQLSPPESAGGKRQSHTRSIPFAPIDRNSPYGDNKKKALEEKKIDLVESPGTRSAYKQFHNEMKEREAESFDSAQAFVSKNLTELPTKVHWKVYLEMADFAKRDNLLQQARRLYRKATQLQPFAPQGWLEYAKMEEECGELDKAKEVLAKGLRYCRLNESLLLKKIKLEEKLNNLPGARSVLGRLKDIAPERSWRLILEGALLECRAGNDDVARKVFAYLMAKVPWYGPIYLEAFKFEERLGCLDQAMEIVEAGLKEIPRYGPLWFGKMRLIELGQGSDKMEALRSTVKQAARSISRELMWKVYFEAAFAEERASNLTEARTMHVHAALHCPDNLRWKVWVGGARTEITFGNTDLARLLYKRGLKEVPAKMKTVVLVEMARLDEYLGNPERSRERLSDMKADHPEEWKVFLEAVMLEIRAGNFDRALEEAEEALKIHPGTGRLWSMCMQLHERLGEDKQMEVFKRALHEVPKSGEVWCEGARMRMNPLSKHFDLKLARLYLEFAIRFTPQYGDSFIEYLRLELLETGLEAAMDRLTRLSINADPNYGSLWFACRDTPLSTNSVISRARELIKKSLYEQRRVYQAAMMGSPASAGQLYNARDGDAVAEAKEGGENVFKHLSSVFHPIIDMDRRKAIFGADTI